MKAHVVDRVYRFSLQKTRTKTHRNVQLPPLKEGSDLVELNTHTKIHKAGKQDTKSKSKDIESVRAGLKHGVGTAQGDVCESVQGRNVDMRSGGGHR